MFLASFKFHSWDDLAEFSDDDGDGSDDFDMEIEEKDNFEGKKLKYSNFAQTKKK